jgi:hypothetical protein
MSTTLTIRSIPQNLAGITLTVPATAWAYSQWKVIAPTTNGVMDILSVAFQVTRITTADTTYEILLELGFGRPGYEVTKVQIPYSFRSDTAVGFYLDTRVFLPELVTVPAGTTVSVRIANSTASADTVNGIYLGVISSKTPIQPTEAALNNNYQFVSAGSGISVTDKIR